MAHRPPEREEPGNGDVNGVNVKRETTDLLWVLAPAPAAAGESPKRQPILLRHEVEPQDIKLVVAKGIDELLLHGLHGLIGSETGVAALQQRAELLGVLSRDPAATRPGVEEPFAERNLLFSSVQLRDGT
jgi:hypothetical protein